MFQTIRIIARTLLLPVTLTAVALTTPSAASAGALPAVHYVRPSSATASAAHLFTPGTAVVAAGNPTSRWAHYVIKWS